MGYSQEQNLVGFFSANLNQVHYLLQNIDKDGRNKVNFLPYFLLKMEN